MNQFKTLALLSVLSALLISVSYYTIGGTGGVVFGILIAAVTNLGSWFYSDKIALAAHRAQPVTKADIMTCKLLNGSRTATSACKTAAQEFMPLNF